MSSLKEMDRPSFRTKNSKLRACREKTRPAYLSFHGLRHVLVTLLLLAETDPKIVSERLGHSNIAITMDIYSHVLPGLQAAAALAIDKQIGIGNSP